MDFLGADGSAAGTVDKEAKTGSVLFCNTCHSDAAHSLSQVSFTSGAAITPRGSEASCLQCHQGRSSSPSVNKTLAGLEADTVNEKLAFINVHYNIAAATLMGNDGQTAYQYDGKSYIGRYNHVVDLSSCTQCHDPHSLAVAPKECSPCHLNVVDKEDLKDIRYNTQDYDGDGNIKEGVHGEIETLHDALYVAIRDYARTVVGKPIAYNPDAFPYFFNDANDDGVASAEEAVAANRYASWTPRLVRLTYNYGFVLKDPGSYAHNPRYVLQFLYDALQDAGEKVPVQVTGLKRP
ncbi:MAG: polyheme membrane-associated cytochrome C [Chloroflexi bacterium]|nr:polyheme membrane-associated cytochrome C [Chloroflexota bacterium]